MSPFLDKQHGTEVCLAEQLERLASVYEIHLFSAAVQDLDLTEIHWHRIPTAPGPHLIGYAWWFVANHVVRWWHKRFKNLATDLTYSPGINCFDADVISVHIVFAEFYRRVGKRLTLPNDPVTGWPLRVHRRLYYWLIQVLERRIYTKPGVPLVVVSRKVAKDLARSYVRTENLHLIYHGCDARRFRPDRRSELRDAARHEIGLRPGDFAILLIGNDWKNKGVKCLLDAAGQLANEDLQLLIAGKDDMSPYRDLLTRHRLDEHVRFLLPRKDVEVYYEVADAYAGPSLEDAFALPPLEAVACGLPVIVSRGAGVSELLHHGSDGFILEDPTDAEELLPTVSPKICGCATPDTFPERHAPRESTAVVADYNSRENFVGISRIASTLPDVVTEVPLECNFCARY